MRLRGVFVLCLLACGKSQGGEVCTPGEQRCDENRLQLCADDGRGYVDARDCAAAGQVCVANQGCLECFPGQLTCGGGDGFDIVKCRSDGSRADTVGRCDPDAGDLCNAGACENACEFARRFRTYEGCEYWAVDLDNAVVSDQGTAAAQQYAVVVSNPMELPATVTVEVNDAPPGAPLQLRVVAQTFLARVPGGTDLQIIDLPAREVDGSSDPRLNDGPGTFLSSNAYRVTSSAPIIAYQFNPLENVGVFSNDASLLLPTAALDRRYLVMGWPQTLALTEDPMTNGTIDLRATLTIVGTEPETSVDVTLAADILGGGGIPAATRGETLSFTIGPFDVINLETDGFNADFTSTFIEADKNIAVFSGSEASDVPSFDSWLDRDCCADHLEEQLFPESALGTQFVAVKTPLRTRYVEEAGWDVALVPDEPEYWRILATVEDTSVTTNLPPPDNAFLLQRGQVVTLRAERDFVVTASRPISFAQFPAGQQTTGIPSVTSGGQQPPGGDPSFILIPPVQQWRTKYGFLVPNKYALDFVMLAAPADHSGFLYDGLPLETALPRCESEIVGTIGDQEYLAIRCPLSEPPPEDPENPFFQDDGPHTLESLDGRPFGLVVWGFDRFVSYGYPAGTNVDVINPL